MEKPIVRPNLLFRPLQQLEYSLWHLAYYVFGLEVPLISKKKEKVS
jgi:hypothetical protein